MILVNDPWPYAIDDTLVDEKFRLELTQYGLNAARENRFGLHFFNDEIFPKDIMDRYQQYYNNLLNQQQYLLDLFPQHKRFNELELQAHLAVQRGDYEYRTHCDHPKKNNHYSQLHRQRFATRYEIARIRTWPSGQDC